MFKYPRLDSHIVGSTLRLADPTIDKSVTAVSDLLLYIYRDTQVGRVPSAKPTVMPSQSIVFTCMMHDGLSRYYTWSTFSWHHCGFGTSYYQGLTTRGLSFRLIGWSDLKHACYETMSRSMYQILSKQKIFHYFMHMRAKNNIGIWDMNLVS